MEKESLYYNALREAGVSYAELSRLKRKGSWATTWNAHPSAKRNGIDPERSWDALAKNGVELILRDDTRFPALLRETTHPPHGLYIKGILPDETHLHLGMVGTRKATDDGVRQARDIAKQLAARGIVIVSGLALGIDRASHMGALEAKGTTLAILGNGLDDIYPHTNKRLAEEILANGGALISEYALNTPSFPSNFLERNRIISGLSRGIVVIEAPVRSGSLATARFALEDNREIFVLPGPATHPNYQGSLKLIREGARLVRDASDIFEDLGLETENAQATIAALTSEAQKIIDALTQSAHPLDIDQLIEKTGLPAPLVSQNVSLLVIQGTIKDNSNGYSL
ncbi:MAG: DNA-processing protein DprA [bacterium]|nr:DNA-processing protein DprA [bacterium]